MQCGLHLLVVLDQQVPEVFVRRTPSRVRALGKVAGDHDGNLANSGGWAVSVRAALALGGGRARVVNPAVLKKGPKLSLLVAMAATNLLRCSSTNCRYACNARSSLSFAMLSYILPRSAMRIVLQPSACCLIKSPVAPPLSQKTRPWNVCSTCKQEQNCVPCKAHTRTGAAGIPQGATWT